MEQTFEAEKTEKRTFGKRVRTAFLVDEKMTASEIINIVLKDYIKILKRLYL